MEYLSKMIAARAYLASAGGQKSSEFQPQWFSAEVADVVVSLADADVKAGVGGDGKLLAGVAGLPSFVASKSVLTGAGHAFHDFRCAGVEGERGRQHHTHGFLCAVCQRDAVADALAIEVHVGLGVDAGVVNRSHAGRGEGQESPPF